MIMRFTMLRRIGIPGAKMHDAEFAMTKLALVTGTSAGIQSKAGLVVQPRQPVAVDLFES